MFQKSLRWPTAACHSPHLIEDTNELESLTPCRDLKDPVGVKKGPQDMVTRPMGSRRKTS